MTDLLEKYRIKAAKDSALLEEKCKRIAYATARRLVKEQLQEQYDLTEQEAASIANNKVQHIKKYANKLLPKIKQTQMPRLGSFHDGDKLENLGREEHLDETLNVLFAEKFEPKQTEMQQAQSEPQQSTTDRRTVTIQPPVANRKPPVVFGPPDRRLDDPKISKAIQKKAGDTTIPEVVLREVFNRGLLSWNESVRVTQEQYAFARVNSYINGGKAYTELDTDLHDLDESILAGLGAVGLAAAGAGGVGAGLGIAKRALSGAAMRLSGEAGQGAKGIMNAQAAKIARQKALKAKKAQQNGTGQNSNGQQQDDDEEEQPMSEKEAKKLYIRQKLGTYRGAAAKGGTGLVKSVFTKSGNSASPAQPGQQNVGAMPSSGFTR